MSKKTKRKAKTRIYPTWRVLVVAVGLLAISAVGLASYQKNWAEAHDLSVVGNGTPTIVQIHDPNCQLCQALRSNTEKALAKSDATIQFRIANIHTDKGRRLQREHQVPHVTLLLFEPDGDIWRKLTGVKSVEALSRVIEQFDKRYRQSS